MIRGNDEDDLVKDEFDKPKNNGVTTFQEINEWMARSDAELVLFKQMDDEMGIMEGKEQKIEEIL